MAVEFWEWFICVSTEIICWLLYVNQREHWFLNFYCLFSAPSRIIYLHGEVHNVQNKKKSFWCDGSGRFAEALPTGKRSYLFKLSNIVLINFIRLCHNLIYDADKLIIYLLRCALSVRPPAASVAMFFQLRWVIQPTIACREQHDTKELSC